ncbi:MAG: hypothetical protein CMK59_06045 [Proteobacteria bacterium]|nr:hypothetical protein [Pseudomonadota bacterium]
MSYLKRQNIFFSPAFILKPVVFVSFFCSCIGPTTSKLTTETNEQGFTIKDMRPPSLLEDECLYGSSLEIEDSTGNTGKKKRWNCVDSYGVKVGPSLERIENHNGVSLKYRWYHDGSINHIPLTYNVLGILDIESTELELMESQRKDWFIEWKAYRPEILQRNEAILFALKQDILSVDTILETPIQKNSCKQHPKDMLCIPESASLEQLSSSENNTRRKKQWQVHAVPTFYMDTEHISIETQNQLLDDCRTDPVFDSLGRRTWSDAAQYCRDRGKTLPSFSEMLLAQKTHPDLKFQREWLREGNYFSEADIKITDQRFDENLLPASEGNPIYVPQKRTDLISNTEKKAPFRCVTHTLKGEHFSSPIQLSSISTPKMDYQRGYGEAWYRTDKEYKAAVRGWKDNLLRENYLKSSSAIKDIYMLPHEIERLLQKYPQQIELWQLGITHFGHPIYALKIHKKNTTDSIKGDLLHLAAIHGNEVLTTNALLKAMERLLNSTESKHQKWLGEYNFWFLPMINPDGNWMAMRAAMAPTFGKKNGKNTEGSCRQRAFEGVDISKNFPNLYPEYPKKNATIEPETKAIIELSQKLNIVSALSLHSGAMGVYHPPISKTKKGSSGKSNLQRIEELWIKRLEQDGFEFKVKALSNPHNEVSWLGASRGSPSWILDYPREIVYEDVEMRNHHLERHQDLIFEYWNTILGTPAIYGKITNEQNEPLNANVSIIEFGTEHKLKTTQGEYHLLLVTPGVLTLRIEADGYVPAEKKIRVKQGVKNINMKLMPE